MISITLISQVKKKEDQLSSHLDDITVLMSLDQGFYYQLDQIGSFIWDLLDEPQTVKALIDLLVDAYEVAPDECEQDLIELLNDLYNNDFIIID